ncbi:CLUMA_CG020777, isoform A [Clunio marinus]|uniref:CLUMA_CG020777, isoform A n=1 Tax=Clunio marinus TaxID=568069 RepID=A0A1J1J603_9DIPT|nr:CLUMA_CG020777, isoform A [Clunio marinus]
MIEHSIDQPLNKFNITECGWKFIKDHKTDELAFNVYKRANPIASNTELRFERKWRRSMNYLMEYVRSYCKSDVYIAQAFNYEVGGRHPNSSLTHNEVCMLKHLIDINIIETKLYKIDDGRYAEENCETLLVEWSATFPYQFNSFDVNFPDELFSLPSKNVLECLHQKINQEKLNEKLASYKMLHTFNLSPTQTEEIRNDYINVYKTLISTMFECLEKLF